MLVDIALSHTNTNYLLKPCIYTIFGYLSVNQPVGDVTARAHSSINVGTKSVDGQSGWCVRKGNDKRGETGAREDADPVNGQWGALSKCTEDEWGR